MSQHSPISSMTEQKTKSAGSSVNFTPEDTSKGINQITNYTVTLEQDPENPDGLIMPIPDDLFEQLGWKIGDELDWQITEYNNIVIRKVLSFDDHP